MTREDIISDVRDNLEDAGITYYSDDDLIDSIQDGYDDVAITSGCIQKSATLDFSANLSYYDFSSLISDYFAVVAIYNNISKRWMFPSSRKEMQGLKRDWELIKGQPMNFFPIDFQRVFIGPRVTENVTGGMTVFYRAQAPTLNSGETPLIHTDEQNLITYYATGDLFDQAEEYIKADAWFMKYYTSLIKYKTRVGRLAKSDYMPIIQATHSPTTI